MIVLFSCDPPPSGSCLLVRLLILAPLCYYALSLIRLPLSSILICHPLVEPTERLRKLDDRATKCFFVGYKYEGGGYRVWDPKRQVIVESRDLVFFEDGLPPPTLNDSRPQPADEARTSRLHNRRLHNLHLITPPNRRRCHLCQMHPHRPKQTCCDSLTSSPTSSNSSYSWSPPTEYI